VGYSGDEAGLGGKTKISGYLAAARERTDRLICGRYSMGRRNITCVSAFIIAVFCGVGLSLENPSVGNPVGSGTAPPTARQPGLVKSPNPIDTSGNLVITGNVANGMQFRGVVPYNSPTSFYAPPGTLGRTSGGIDSFLRNTAGSQNFETSSGGLTPYYSPVWTVTTTQPGGRVVATGDYGKDSFTGAGTNLPGAQVGYYQGVNSSQNGRRPLSMSREDLEKLVQSDVARYPKDGQADSKLQDQFWRDMGIQLQRKDDKLSTDIAKPVTGNESNLEILLGMNAKKTQDTRDKQQVDNNKLKQKSDDVFEQMQMSSDRQRNGLNIPRVDPNESRPGVTPEEFAQSYKSFAAHSDDKFNQHMNEAENFMKQGRFYRAADAYTLASIYKPNDPLGYAGKSLALFGSGEYLSSSLFLARALEIFPGYAKVRVDLVGMIGDKDTVENRILEAREWMDRSDSGELEFLLSYIYYQMDRMEFSQKSIEAAAKKMPDSPAVAAMKKAVDERLAKP
jgi:tetratricopeptide (TPR) repeat protein